MLFRRLASHPLLGLSLVTSALAATACSSDTTTPASSTTSAGAGATTDATTTSSSTGGAGGMSGAGGTGGSGGSIPIGDQPNCNPPAGDLPALKLTPFAEGLDFPVLIKPAPGDDTRLFIVEQSGRIRIVKDGVLQADPFVDLSAIIKNSGVVGDERGLIGLAFHPTYAQSGRLFVHYSDIHSDTVVAELHAIDADHADPTPTVVLTQDQPEVNHNGGSIEFSPKDGMLYIGLGDGGGANDQHGDPGNGQGLDTQLGKILRIDVDSLPYSIPPGNLQIAGALPQIWDYGLRNPWRFSFDACTSDLYIGDVGQNLWEEIDIEPAGQGKRNYGWRLMEGMHCFNPADSCDPGNTTILPMAEYSHSIGCSVSGGYVYRGSAIAGLRGAYIYGDYCSGRVWTLRYANGESSVSTAITDDLESAGKSIVSFGQDHLGEVYVVTLAGTVYRIDPE